MASFSRRALSAAEAGRLAIWEMRLATAGCANAHDRGMPGSENVSVSDRITMRFECSSIMVAVDSPPNVRSMPRSSTITHAQACR